MELIPINDSKLKIMLDERDMKEYNIDDEADCANSETRMAIRHILECAKDKIGFNTEGSEIFVQLYTSKKGGCELFVTKGELSTAPNEKKTKRSKRMSEGEERQTTSRAELGERRTHTEFGRMIYSFYSLEDLCRVCRILLSMSLDVKSRAYFGEDGEYYLLLENASISAYARLDKLTFILEYGMRERFDHTSLYISEHTKTLCPDRAIETLALF